MNIKEFLPPILIRLAKRAIGLGIGDSKKFESYAKALQASTSDAYQNIELCNMIAEKTVIHLEKLNEKPFVLNQANALLLAVINQYLNSHSTKILNILDFGGACGAHYFEVRRFISDEVSLRWYVVETPQMVKSAMEKGLNNDELIFVDSIPDIKTGIDIVNSSCALNYVIDPYEILNMIVSVNADWMFFSRMFYNDSDNDFITVQKSFLSSNGPGPLPKGYSDKLLSYPNTIISFNNFYSTITNFGYKAEWIFSETSDHNQTKSERFTEKNLLYVRK